MSHVLVIGGTRGIGKAIADRIADTHRVTAWGRNKVDIASVLALNDALVSIAEPVHGVVFVPRGEITMVLRAFDAVCRWAFTERAKVVCVNSVASFGFANTQDADYHALKAAQAAIIRYYAVHNDERTRFNGVCPGTIRSDGSGDCTPVEVADVIAFLLSPASAAINGQHIVLDRGRSLRLP